MSIAILLHVSVDTARQYTYRQEFPALRVLGARNQWMREEILAWFAALPGEPSPSPLPRPTTR